MLYRTRKHELQLQLLFFFPDIGFRGQAKWNFGSWTVLINITISMFSRLILLPDFLVLMTRICFLSGVCGVNELIFGEC